MAKGLGAIMAAVSAAITEDRIRKGEAVLCPLCGQPMKFEGVAWFCRSGPRKDNGHNDHCDLAEMMSLFLNPDEDRYIDDWQRAVFAAVVRKNPAAPGGVEILGTLHTVRGYGGCTNLTVSCDPALREELPGLINAHGWTWAEWTGRE